MKIYEVTWKTACYYEPTMHSIIIVNSGWITKYHKKIFVFEDKAKEFVRQLKVSATFIGMHIDSLEIKIHTEKAE